MSIQKRKERKKRLKKEQTKIRVSKRRATLQEKRKLENQERERQNHMEELMHGKIKPIVTNPEKLTQIESSRQKAALEKLQQNLQLLESLEKEYETEEAMRASINASLEAEGHNTLKEKMDALHEKALNSIEMDPEKRKVLEQAGLKIGNAEEFLNDKE
jgi:hypothetical protein